MNPRLTSLQQFLENSARESPEHIAVVEPGAGSVSYRELAALSDGLRDLLVHLGVKPGDRVGVYLRKSVDAVAAIFGILKAGAAYVPVDPTGPPARNAYILADCSVRAVIVEAQRNEKLQAEWGESGKSIHALVLDGTGGGRPLAAALHAPERRDPAPPSATVSSGPGDLAYILYTSGSTGKPKGVMLSHRNAVSYVDWCSEVFSPTADDRFSSHAPFHFDLSILDIYVPLKHAATLVLISDEAGKDPGKLAPLIESEKITVWYSTPSILTLLTQYGRLQERDYRALRMVLFAGEVFPVKHLRALRALLPAPRYFNLYGPTETNVCTYFELTGEIPPGRDKPFPIGIPCSHARTLVVDEQMRPVRAGEEGELLVTGDAVCQGYWNLPENTARAFHAGADGVQWYRTGDVVVEEPDSNYTFLGRRDRMVKRRGYRVELGEIEIALYRHPAIKEAAVVALPDEEAGVRVKAFLCCHEGKRPSMIELKQFCADALPSYMVPDIFSFHDLLPKTSTDKTDYQRLKELR